MGKKLEAAMPQPSEKKDPEDYEVKDAADTLMRAEDIKRDKRLMPHVHKHMKKKMRSLKELTQMGRDMDAGKKDDHDEDDKE